MSPDELRRANIEHFRHLLARTRDRDERARIEALMQEEERKPASAYPSDRPSGAT